MDIGKTHLSILRAEINTDIFDEKKRIVNISFCVTRKLSEK